MKQTPHLKAIFKERTKKIEQVLERRLQEQARELVEKEERCMREKEQLVSKVESVGGLWKSGSEMEVALARIQEKARRLGKKESLDALKNQLSYRKKILLQAGNPKDWTFSENGRPLSVDGLKTKLMKFLSPEVVPPMTRTDD